MSLVLDETKLAIAKAIHSLRNELGKKKLSVVAVAERVGISRQAINKSHNEFILPIKGEVEIPKTYLDVLIDKNYTGSVNIEEYNELRQRHEKELLAVKTETFTSLMKNDLSIHKAKLLKNEQINMQKQLLDRISDNKKLETTIGDEKSKVLELQQKISELEVNGGSGVSRVVINPDMRVAFEDFKNTSDNRGFLMAQDFSYRQAVKHAIEEVIANHAITIYTFIHRHNADIDKYMKRIPLPSGRHIFLTIPLALRDKRKKVL